jgi:hypothetical protein
MSKNTLLDMVQGILNDLDADEVNSISDTVEATQVADIIRSTFHKLEAERAWPYEKRLLQLDGLSDITRPSHLKLDSTIDDISKINYDKRRTVTGKSTMLEVKYINPDSFLKLTNTRDSSSTDVKQVTDTSGAVLLIATNTPPAYWTSFDDDHIVFDSYDTLVDSTIQTSKTQVLATVNQVFVMADDAIPPIPSNAFPLLLAKAKLTASSALNQFTSTVDVKDERRQRLNQNNRTRKTTRYTAKYGRQR